MSDDPPDATSGSAPPAAPMEKFDARTLLLHLRSILASVPDGMIVIDERGEILAFSEAAERLFGYSGGTLIGKNVSCLMGGHDERNHDNYVSKYIRTGEKQIIGKGRVVFARRADGSQFPIDLRIGEARLGDGFLFTAFVRDLTDQRRGELRIQELQAELSHFSRLSAVGTMASALAHELNQPLTAVANYLEAGRDLLDEKGEEAREILREALDEAARQAVRAGEIVRKLRSYVSRGEVEAEPVVLAPLLHDAVALMRLTPEFADMPVFIEIGPGVDRVLADPIQVQQVAINLLRNAMEVLRGKMDARIEVHARPAGNGLIGIEVCDNGPGLTEEMRRSLFKPFQTTKAHGMGLGLSICQTIIEAHGGTICAESRNGWGACFRFTLPAVTAAP
jgi:two-component system sensor kinase FixL